MMIPGQKAFGYHRENVDLLTHMPLDDDQVK